ncbi:hypothetical protein TKK_0008779 [Trichogramma kaykai]
MEVKLYELNSTEVRQLAFEYAERMKLPHRFNCEKKIAGEDWLKNFVERHELSYRKAEHTSSARSKGFCKEAVETFIKLYLQVLKQHDFQKNIQRESTM